MGSLAGAGRNLGPGDAEPGRGRKGP